jgi:hypothetical protein
MRLVSRTGIIATALAIGAIAAPNAQAGLFSTGPDPKGAAQQEAQSFLRIYSHPASTPSAATPDLAAVARDKASIGAAFDRIALAFDRDSTSTATPVAGIAQGSPGFRYGDAAIGAGMMAGLILLGAAGALAVRRRAQSRHP